MKENDLKTIAADILFYYFIFTRKLRWRKRSKKEIKELFDFQTSCADRLHNLSHIAIGRHNMTFARSEIESAISGILRCIEVLELDTELKYSELQSDLEHFKMQINSKMKLLEE